MFTYSAIYGVAREKSLGAERLICLLAEAALQARAVDPLFQCQYMRLRWFQEQIGTHTFTPA